MMRRNRDGEGRRDPAFVIEFDGLDDRERTGASSGGADVRDLARWLQSDEDLRGWTAVRMRGPDPGEQGGVADAILVSASAAFLAEPLATWLQRRAATRAVRIRVTAASGAIFADGAAGRADGQRLVRRLMEFLGRED